MKQAFWIMTNVLLACVASVSSRGSSRKLGQEQKKHDWKRTQANVLLVRYSSRSAGLDHGHIDGSLNTEKGEVKKRLTDACSMIHKLSNADCACKTLRWLTAACLTFADSSRIPFSSSSFALCTRFRMLNHWLKKR